MADKNNQNSLFDLIFIVYFVKFDLNYMETKINIAPKEKAILTKYKGRQEFGVT